MKNSPLPIVAEMLNAAFRSVDNLKDQIDNVKYGLFDLAEPNRNPIEFTLRGVKYIGQLKGRNRDYCLGFGVEQDKAIVCRVLLDGHAEPI